MRRLSCQRQGEFRCVSGVSKPAAGPRPVDAPRPAHQSSVERPVSRAVRGAYTAWGIARLLATWAAWTESRATAMACRPDEIACN